MFITTMRRKASITSQSYSKKAMTTCFSLAEASNPSDKRSKMASKVNQYLLSKRKNKYVASRRKELNDYHIMLAYIAFINTHITM